MTDPRILALASEDVSLRTIMVSSVGALLASFGLCDEVKAVRRGMEDGSITAVDLQEACELWLEEIQRGYLLPHREALMAVVSCLDGRDDEASQALLQGLSDLRIREIVPVYLMAERCLLKEDAA